TEEDEQRNRHQDEVVERSPGELPSGQDQSRSEIEPCPDQPENEQRRGDVDAEGQQPEQRDGIDGEQLHHTPSLRRAAARRAASAFSCSISSCSRPASSSMMAASGLPRASSTTEPISFASASTPKKTRPSTHRPCGMTSGVASGVGDRAESAQDSSSTSTAR